jgi:hypothetical protein
MTLIVLPPHFKDRHASTRVSPDMGWPIDPVRLTTLSPALANCHLGLYVALDLDFVMLCLPPFLHAIPVSSMSMREDSSCEMQLKGKFIVNALGRHRTSGVNDAG